MTMAPRLRRFLERRQLDYDVLPHEHTGSSLETARVSHVPPQKLAKGVLLEDESGYLMAVVPASRRVDLRRLGDQLHRELELADEDELRGIFLDCDRGALPPVGSAYQIPTVYDESLCHLRDVYFEAGDHEDVVHMSGSDFLSLFASSRHGHFSHVL